MKSLWRLLLCVGLTMSTSVQAVQSAIWDKTPIRIQLVVGVEQMIYFPTSGQVGLPSALAHRDIFTTLFAGKTAYWTALQPFEAARVKVRLAAGEYIMFDVVAVVEETQPNLAEPLNIVIADSNDTFVHPQSAVQTQPTIFDLIRYAAQATFSPARLVEPLLGIRDVPIGISGNLNGLYNHQQHKGLIFTPQKSWAVDGLFVTAVTVINRHTHSITLDNRLVQHTPNANRQGVERHFVASSFYRNQLAKGGEKGNRTTLFIVTDQPFQSVLRL